MRLSFLFNNRRERTGDAVKKAEDRAKEWAASVTVIEHEDPEDEPTMGGGAAVRNLSCEEDAEEDVPTGCHPLFDLKAGGRTDVGRIRRGNEDALLLLGDESVFAVADGMGGHAGGEIASQLAVEAVAAVFTDEVETGPCILRNVPPRAAELVRSVAAANEAVRSRAAKNATLSDMGTTIVAARFCPFKGRLYVTHVGDSRCYRLRNGALQQLTTDHTLAELGYTGKEALHLSRAIGARGIVETDVTILEPRQGDVYLLCTDGLTRMLDDAAITDVLSGEPDPNEAAALLVRKANANGGRDNVTAVVVRIDAPPKRSAKRKESVVDA